jgi:DNA-binding response OmpR family regulator
MKVLLVEDDETIGAALQRGLSARGYHVDWYRTGHPALDASPADLVLLDLGLPDVDGVQVCRELRARRPDAVIVMLTARDAEPDVVLGLDAGADDYLVKPVRLAELDARLRAHLRRVPAVDGTRRRLGDLVLDTAARRVELDGAEVALRAKEYDLLARLAAEPGVAVSRDTLMADVWDEHWYGSTKTLDVHVATLRRRLAEAAGQRAVPVIVTLRGHGYRLDTPGIA